MNQYDLEADPDYEAARIGVEAVDFMSRDVGISLLKKAAFDLREAQKALETVDPNDFKQIRYLQAEAYRARHFIQWLANLKAEGEIAHQNLRDKEHDD